MDNMHVGSEPPNLFGNFGFGFMLSIDVFGQQIADDFDVFGDLLDESFIRHWYQSQSGGWSCLRQ